MAHTNPFTVRAASIGVIRINICLTPCASMGSWLLHIVGAWFVCAWKLFLKYRLRRHDPQSIKQLYTEFGRHCNLGGCFARVCVARAQHSQHSLESGRSCHAFHWNHFPCRVVGTETTANTHAYYAEFVANCLQCSHLNALYIRYLHTHCGP